MAFHVNTLNEEHFVFYLTLAKFDHCLGACVNINYE